MNTQIKIIKLATLKKKIAVLRKKKRKIAFEVEVGTKKRAWEEMKKKYPKGRIFVIGFHLKKGG